MQRNDSKATPKGYKSYNVLRMPTKDGYKELNILVKKSWLDKNLWWVLLLGFALLVAYKIMVGDWEV